MFFMRNGVYEFDQTKLSAAHQWCQEMTHKSLKDGFDTWVSNTFTTSRELRPYFEIAKQTDSAAACCCLYDNAWEL